jgi:cytochrome P450
VLTTSGAWPRLARGEIPVHQVVEEVLRHQSPIDTAIWRTARVDTRLAGAAIKAGDPVYVSLHLANFDAASRRYPEGFDPDRTDTGHVSFGHGAHFCLGAVLARTELAIVFSALAERFPALRLAVPLDELEWTVGSMLNAPTSLPVSW